jgi:hypothetical protein
MHVHAAPITFTGIVSNNCILNVSTPGGLAAAASGTTLSSEELGGINALLVVIATGASPTLQFETPQLTGPNGAIPSATTSIGLTSLSGTSQPFVSSGFNFTASRLLDTLTVRAKATNADGFPSGTYTITTNVTCQQ